MSAAEIRHVIRRLRQSPGYTTTAVMTFALAIGANSAIFSAVNTVLLRPLPVQRPGDLAVVWQSDDGGRAVIELTHRHLREWTAAGNIFARAALIGSHNWSAVLQGRGAPSRIWFNGVSASFFETLGVNPLLGRAFHVEDDVPNAPPVAVLNHGTWLRRFGGDPKAVGTTMILDGEPVEIVGVMPPGVDFPRGAEFWMPAVPILARGTPSSTSNLNTVGVFYVLGRLRPGLPMRALRAAIDATEARLDMADPGRLKWGSKSVVTPFLDHVFGPVRPALRVLWAAVVVLLLIACANVSGLMLTRVSQQQHEHAVRLVLGATPVGIGRLWLTEILIVSVSGGLLGLAAAYWMTRAIVALAPDDLPRLADITIDTSVALFTFAAVMVVALATGAMPFRHAGAIGLVAALGGERSTSSPSSLYARSTLLVAQIGLSVVLLVAAGLVLRSFVELRRVELGFAPDRVLSLTVQPGGTDRPQNLWLGDFLRRVRTLPDVEMAGAVSLRPLMLGPIGEGIRVVLEGQPETRRTTDANPTLNHQVATTGYFEALKIPLRAGRFFTDRDTAGMPRVAILSESAARRLWPGQNPVGKRLLISTFSTDGPLRAWRTVVGVVSDVRYHGLEQVQLDVYDPALQMARAPDNIIVRTSGDPMALAGPVRAVAQELDPAAILDSITTMEAVVGRAAAPWRLTMWMFVLFATLAFALATLGLFSLVALDVAHRGREFAVRLALGAPRAAVVRGVLRRAAGRVLAGLACGLIVSFVATRALRGVLFGIAPHDGVTYATVLSIVAVVVGVAAYVPARRAVRADPQALLRHG